jgi:riboflavin synthase alpha subunit
LVYFPPEQTADIVVEHLGVISSLTPLDTSSSGGNGFSATITDVGPILEDVHLGDSISINGSSHFRAKTYP